MPPSLVMAVGAGIGLAIAFIGLCEWSISSTPSHVYRCGEAPTGLGVIGGNTVSFVGLGGCNAERMSCKRFTIYSTRDSINFQDYVAGLPGYCAGHVLEKPTVWLGVFVGG